MLLDSQSIYILTCSSVLAPGKGQKDVDQADAVLLKHDPIPRMEAAIRKIADGE
jgi:hypothetical protein